MTVKNYKDEFYTQYADIERELVHYKQHFKDKVVYCNCDDHQFSHFPAYFVDNFNRLGLKKLICTHLFKFKTAGGILDAPYMVFDGKRHEYYLKGDGDFRSPECIEFLKESDIVVTNPPFSLFRKHLLQAVEYNKKFIILGPQKEVGFRPIFELFKENKVWFGYGFKGTAAYFINKHYQDYASAECHKDGLIRVPGVHWFTNLELDKRCDNLDLTCTYSPEKYPKYDNFDAININAVKEIPKDYYNLMGVPLTFIHKHNPNQFEIVGLDNFKGKCLVLNGKNIFTRIIIKKLK